MGTQLTSGARLGPYEIVAPAGTGGMGEVYKARDTRLDRIVAVKVLLTDASETSPRRHLFEREARALSQLNHPHVCMLYDVGEQAPSTPSAEPIRYLVMEFLEGETLAQRLERGALPIEQGITFGVQIADALDKVHRTGIVHGDLKPGNIMLTRTGVKLLDFGLARLQRRPPPGGWQEAVTRTVTVPTAGALFGTLQYLAPEQLEGREADERSDIFACGAVMFEMIAGRPAFTGETPAAVMAAIMTQTPPPLSRLQPAATPALDHVVATCLARDPFDRWQNAGDLMRELKWVSGAGLEATATTSRAGGLSKRGSIAAIAAGLVTLTALAIAAAINWPREGAADRAVYRTSILLPEGLGFTGAGERGGIERFAISPDGRQLAFVATDANGNQMLWVRPLASLAATSIAGTDGAISPFWAADSRRIAFTSRGQLKVVGLDGAPPRVVTAPALGTAGTWNGDDVIVFTPTIDSPLHQVPARGGTPAPVTELDQSRGEVLHRSPWFLPDGRRFLYVAVTARDGGTTGARGVFAGSLDSGQPVQVLDSGSLAKFAQGQLLFVRENALVAQPFDPDRLALAGEPRTLAEQIELIGPLSGAFTVSTAGPLAYQASGPGSQLVWFDRDGRQLGTLGEPGRYGDLELSPDGRQAIVSVLDPETNTRDLWLFEVERGVRTRFTRDPADDVAPVWSPDSAQVVFASNRRGHFDVFQKPASGLAPEQLAYADESEKYPTSWVPGAGAILYWTFDSDGTNLSLLTLGGEDAPRPVIETAVQQARLSPDGRWLAYNSGESGRSEVYVVPYPGLSRRWQVSIAGGTLPRWAQDGREIVFAGRDNRLMSVSIEPTSTGLEVSAPRALFDVRPVAPRSFFAVAPDGGRVLVNTLQGDSRMPSITVVQNWLDGLGP